MSRGQYVHYQRSIDVTTVTHRVFIGFNCYSHASSARRAIYPNQDNFVMRDLGAFFDESREARKLSATNRQYD